MNPSMAWWRHQMETFSALLAICAGHSPVSGEFPAQRPVTRAFDVSFDLRLNKRLSKQSLGWWLETLSCSLWRQSNGFPSQRASYAPRVSMSWRHNVQLDTLSHPKPTSIIHVPSHTCIYLCSLRLCQDISSKHIHNDLTLKQLGAFRKCIIFLILFPISVIFLYESGPI